MLSVFLWNDSSLRVSFLAGSLDSKARYESLGESSYEIATAKEQGLQSLRRSGLPSLRGDRQ